MTPPRSSYIDGSDALVVLDGSAKSCERYAAIQRASKRHSAMLDQINAAFSA
jgi:hypothetical protein